jgi:type II secretory pathway component PulK
MHWRYRLSSRRGVVIMIVLWVVIILAALTLSLARKSRIDVALARYALGYQEAYQLAWNGFTQAQAELLKDGRSEESRDVDTLFACGVDLSDGRLLEEVFFKQYPEGSWKIGHPVEGTDFLEIDYGVQDEERRINLNALSEQTVPILKELIIELGYSEDQASLAAYRLLDWMDTDQELSHDEWGLEQATEDAEQAATIKNAPLDSFYELSLVNGFSEELMHDLEELTTIFPREGNFKINFETAQPVVLKAVAKASSGPATNTDVADALSLVDKMLIYRRGNDGVDGTDDDHVLEMNEMPLNAKEKVLFLLISQYRVQASQWFRIPVLAQSHRLKYPLGFEWIINRDDGEVVRFRTWKRP